MPSLSCVVLSVEDTSKYQVVALAIKTWNNNVKNSLYIMPVIVSHDVVSSYWNNTQHSEIERLLLQFTCYPI